MKNLISILVFVIFISQSLFSQHDESQTTYTGLNFITKRENLKDNVTSSTIQVTMTNSGVIDYGSLVFFPYDESYTIFLGIPKELIGKNNIEELVSMTLRLYHYDGSPPVLHLYKITNETMHFTMYLRNVDNDKDFVIQTFIGFVKE